METTTEGRQRDFEAGGMEHALGPWADVREVEPDTLVDFEARAALYAQLNDERHAGYKQGFASGERRLAEHIAIRIDAALSQSRDRAATCRDLVAEIETLCRSIVRPF